MEMSFEAMDVQDMTSSRTWKSRTLHRGHGIENMVIEDQVVDLLLEHAKVTDQAATFKDVMNFGA